MNRDLEILQKWATDKAATDDDTSARPLWAQIAREVETYRLGEDVTIQTGPSLFGDAS